MYSKWYETSKNAPEAKVKKNIQGEIVLQMQIAQNCVSCPEIIFQGRHKRQGSIFFLH